MDISFYIQYFLLVKEYFGKEEEIPQFDFYKSTLFDCKLEVIKTTLVKENLIFL